MPIVEAIDQQKRSMQVYRDDGRPEAPGTDFEMDLERGVLHKKRQQDRCVIILLLGTNNTKIEPKIGKNTNNGNKFELQKNELNIINF